MNNKGFTLVEILIVVFLVGIIAGFGLPNYTKAVSRAKKRNAINNMRMLHSSLMIYERRNGVYWPENTTAQLTASIETNLLDDLVDLDDDYSYFCRNLDGTFSNFQCRATRGSCTLTLTEDLLSDTNPSESAGCD